MNSRLMTPYIGVCDSVKVLTEESHDVSLEKKIDRM